MGLTSKAVQCKFQAQVPLVSEPDRPPSVEDELKLSEIIYMLDLEPLNKMIDSEIKIGFVSDMVSDTMACAKAGSIWVTVQTHKKVIASANLVDIPVVVVTQGKRLKDDVLKLADKMGVTVLSTPMESFELVGRMYQAGIR